MKIAVIGTGISGNACAWLLTKNHDITVYEKEPRPGGHAHTVDIIMLGPGKGQGQEQEVTVDTGFIVYNERNYPHLTGMFDHLGVKTEDSDMSFSVFDVGQDFEWCSRGVKGMFAQPENLTKRHFWSMLEDVMWFYNTADQNLALGRMDGLSLGDYLDKEKFGTAFRDHFLLPMGAAIWSMPSRDILDFPADRFVTFFKNHGLTSFNRPKWRTVTGGSRSYVMALTAAYESHLHLSRAAVAITPDEKGAWVSDESGEKIFYDHVILACHSDEALALIKDTDLAAKEVLKDVRYAPNDVYLHSDTRLMPKRKSAWASWNYRLGNPEEEKADAPLAVSYWMNLLQNLETPEPLIITLNPPFAPDESKIYGRYSYAHPQFDAAASRAQEKMQGHQGQGNISYCGAWLGYGFHEDGLSSAVDVVKRLGEPIPWA